MLSVLSDVVYVLKKCLRYFRITYYETFSMDSESEEEVIIIHSSVDDVKFDTIVGHIEDIIMDDKFHALQTEFLNKYYHHFETTEENKLVYMEIFKEYTDLLEKHLEDELVNKMPDFSMDEFSKQLIMRKEELNGEVFEMLLTFSDFFAFKEMFLDFKAMKEGSVADLYITPLSYNCIKNKLA